MAKILEMKYHDSRKNIDYKGRMEIKEQQDNAELYIYGDIVGTGSEKWSEEDKCPQDIADFLNGLNGAKSIDIYVNSGGGDAFAGLAIHNILKRNQAAKIGHIDGLAASAATLPIMACDKIVAPSSAQFMIHQPWTITIGNANDLRKTADTLDKLGESYQGIYESNLKDGSDADIKQLMDSEKWMNGNEMAELFNNVEINEEQAAACTSAFFREYRNTPKSLIEKPKEPATPQPDPQYNTEEKNKLLLEIDLI